MNNAIQPAETANRNVQHAYDASQRCTHFGVGACRNGRIGIGLQAFGHTAEASNQQLARSFGLDPLLRTRSGVTFHVQPSLFNVRAIRLILTAIFAIVAVTAGLFVAAAVAVVGFAIYLATRLFGSRRTGTVTDGTFRSSRRSQSAASGDAIDVTATEVDADSTEPAGGVIANGRLRE